MSARFCRILCAVGRLPVLVASRPLVLGREAVPRESGCLLAVNHTHAHDVTLVMSVMPRPLRWVTAAELTGGPWAWVQRGLDNIPLRRSVVDAAAARAVLRGLRAGACIGIFPEGRIRTGEDRVTHHGHLSDQLMRLAAAAGVPVVPCVVAGSWRLGKVAAWLPLRRTRWAVVFGEPLAPTAGTAALVEQMRALYRTAAAHADPDDMP